MTFTRAFRIVAMATCCWGVWAPVAAQAIYRCGNEYTNQITDAQARTCKLVQGGNVTVVSGPRPAAQAATSAGARAPATSSTPPQTARINPTEQKARDSDARAILEAELQRAQAHQAELQLEYNHGEPERRGDEGRNYQKYLDRVNEIKASMARNESDIAGIKRELGRLNPGN